MAEKSAHTIVVRAIRLDFDPAEAGVWHNGSALYSHMFNSLSAFLPRGEAFFVRAVHATADIGLAGTAFGAELDAFSRQEMAHGRQHARCNQAITVGRPIMTQFDRYLARAFDLVYRLSSKRMRLAYTMAVEHLTSTLARVLLSRPERLTQSKSDFALLWLWHGLEELEHKSTACIRYRQIGGGYIGRASAMLVMGLPFLFEWSFLVVGLLAYDKMLWRRHVFKDALAFWISPSLWKGLGEVIQYFSFGFDPDARDDSEMVAVWRRYPALLERLERAQPTAVAKRAHLKHAA